MKAMRWGYSTGTCAAAASKAALIRLLQDRVAASVRVELPDGHLAEIPVTKSWRTEYGAIARVIKDAGDDPDVTNGISILAEVRLLPAAGIVIKGGAGVGTVTKPGLSVPVGEPAINPVPRSMIERALLPLLPPGQGLKVVISAPGGQRARGGVQGDARNRRGRPTRPAGGHHPAGLQSAPVHPHAQFQRDKGRPRGDFRLDFRPQHRPDEKRDRAPFKNRRHPLRPAPVDSAFFRKGGFP